jgi:hypothetical protein
VPSNKHIHLTSARSRPLLNPAALHSSSASPVFGGRRSSRRAGLRAGTRVQVKRKESGPTKKL